MNAIEGARFRGRFHRLGPKTTSLAIPIGKMKKFIEEKAVDAGAMPAIFPV